MTAIANTTTSVPRLSNAKNSEDDIIKTLKGPPTDLNIIRSTRFLEPMSLSLSIHKGAMGLEAKTACMSENTCFPTPHDQRVVKIDLVSGDNDQQTLSL